MPSQVDLCNRALARIGTKSTISDLSESSQEAYNCGLFFEQSRDDTLRSVWWGFATARATLALTGTPPSEWSYQYALPTDCLDARYIVNPLDVSGGIFGTPQRGKYRPVPFDIGLAAAPGGTGSINVLLSNLNAAVLVYTARVTDINLWDASFINAFTWRLAADVAIPITGNGELQAKAEAGFAQAISRAANTSQNEGVLFDDHTPDWIRVRGEAYCEDDYFQTLIRSGQ